MMKTYETEADTLHDMQLFITTAGELCQVVVDNWGSWGPPKIECKNLWTGQYFNLDWTVLVSAFDYQIRHRRRGRFYWPKNKILTFRYRRRAFVQKNHHEPFFIKYASFISNHLLE